MSRRALRSPVRVAIDDYHAQTDPARRLDALVLAFERLIRLDALVMAAAFLGDEQCRDDKVRAILLSHGLVLGQWVTLLRALAYRLPSGAFDPLRAWIRQIGLQCPPTAPSWPVHSPCKYNALDTLLFLRNRRAHGETRTTEEFVGTALEVAECCMGRCIDEHPSFPEFFADGDVVVADFGTFEQRCDPFLIPGERAGAPRDVLIYAGADTKHLSYESIAGASHASKPARAHLVERLGTRLATFESIDPGVPDHVMSQRLYECTQGTLRRAEDLRRYRPDTLVRRAEPDLVLRAFLEGSKPLLVVEGPPGAGKTSWLCAVAEDRSARGLPTLFVAADRLAHLRFPDCLGEAVRVHGDLAGALERLSVTSADGLTLVAVDDLGSSGHEAEALSTLLSWVEHLPTRTPLRLVVSLRPEVLCNCPSVGDVEVSARCVRYALPPLDGRELLDLAARLPCGPGAESLVQVRKEVASRLAETHGGSLRRPGLAVPLLEGVEPGDAGAVFSVPAVYERLLKSVVLEVGADGLPRYPARGQLVRLLATELARTSATNLPIDAPGLRGLVDDAGRRRPPYQELLVLNVLVETLSDDYVPLVSFADPRFFEFLAALGLDAPGLMSLVERADRYQSALDIAAFAVWRLFRSSGIESAWTPVRDIGPLADLVHKIASIDGDCYVSLLDPLAIAHPSLPLATAARLIDTGEPRLGIRAAKRILATATDERVATEAHFLCARGHFELDEYGDATRELAAPEIDGSVRGLLLRGDVEVSRDAFDAALGAYEAAVAMAGNSARRAHGLRGRGYCLMRLGRWDEAMSPLREAVAELEPGETRQMAEALGDLGELLCSCGCFDEARALLNRSLSINRCLGSLPGTGIVHGLLARVDVAQGRLDEARVRMDQAEAIAHRTGNRWRQAWVLELRAELATAEGRQDVAEKLTAEARRMFEGLA